MGTIAGGWVRVRLAVAVHPRESVTVKVWVPADKLLGFETVEPLGDHK
jgi:hypothetical protein